MSFALATIAHGQDGTVPALVVDNMVLPLPAVGDAQPLLHMLQDWEALLPRLETLALDVPGHSAALPVSSVRFAAPYRPHQVFCTGANYRKHVIGLIMGDPSMRTGEDNAASDEDRRARAEKMMDERARCALPYCFVKLPSCVVGPMDDVILPNIVEKPDWELELGVVIGKKARHISPEAAMDHVAGFAIVNDVTARDHVFRRDNSAIGADWLSGKCFPTFLPFGPLIVPRKFVPNPYDLTIRLSVNGTPYQDESTRDMMINIERQIAFLSDRVELQPGDILCTGSPYGNGAAFGVFLKPGDVMEGSITGLGTQRNNCVAEPLAPITAQ